jgi:cytochrome oxidase Cu insertion factor (SCO1/SenC/PrrC family)
VEGGLAIRASRLPSAVLLLWLTSTLLWWTFAFAPLPSTPPAWLTAARAACFGAAEDGLPGAAGVILLVLAPLSSLAVIVALWGGQLGASLRGVTRSRLGQAVLVLVVLAVAVEGSWVARKMAVARDVRAWAPTSEDGAALPAAYPRQTSAAPDFELVDQRGAPVSLARFKGRPVAITFVFAHCETMCPLVIETLKRATAGPGGAEVLLVTLDPWRDTPSALPGIARRWALPDGFHVLSGTRAADVLRVAEAFGVPSERDERTGDITHPGLVFLIDAEGRLGYTFNNPAPTWVRDGLLRLGRAHADAG